MSFPTRLGNAYVQFMLLIVLAHVFPFVGVEWLHFEGWSDAAIVATKVSLMLLAVLRLLVVVIDG